MYIRSYVVAAALTLAAFSGVANAQQSDDAAEVAALASVSVNATDAIVAVEKLGKGTVVELALETAGAPHYAITAQATDGTETNYVVDATTGAAVEVGEAWSYQGDGDGETMDDGANDRSDGDGETADDGRQGHDQGDGDGEANDDGPNANDQGDGDGETNDDGQPR